MTRFLFWNLGKKPIVQSIVDVAVTHNIDVLILAECVIPPDVLLVDLNKHSRPLYDYARSIGCEKIEIFTRFPRQFFKPISETDRLTIRSLNLPGTDSINVAAVHLPSKLHQSAESQSAASIELSYIIKKAEAISGHTRTVLVGDLNMDPFESGVISANGLHAVSSRKIAERKSRTVQGKDYPFFYNPMWNLLGDVRTSSPGSYYYSSAEYVTRFWHMFDQVLIRPSLVDIFDFKELKIITTAGTELLISDTGIPNKRLASDHLPLVFELSL
jgi:hypothetical protein